MTRSFSELSRENPGLQPGSPSRIPIGNLTADTVHSINPSANQGRGEHDWIVAIPQKDAMRYFVFVSPEPDFEKMRPTFEHILNSIRLQ